MMGSTYWETFPTGSLILSRRLWMNFISEDLNIDLDMDRKSSFKLLFHLFRILIFRFHTKTAGDTKFQGVRYSKSLDLENLDGIHREFHPNSEFRKHDQMK